jgi:hypothetical protein
MCLDCARHERIRRTFLLVLPRCGGKRKTIGNPFTKKRDTNRKIHKVLTTA